MKMCYICVYVCMYVYIYIYTYIYIYIYAHTQLVRKPSCRYVWAEQNIKYVF
jgi:hypothetical protein